MGAARSASAQCSTCDGDVSFTTNPEFAGPYAQATTAVNVNLGNNPATFVTEAYWQVYGSAPSPATVTTQVNNLLTLPYWRRIDVVNTFLTAASSPLTHVYSEPWQSEPQFLTPPCKNVTRDVGAVCMFFFNCPNGVNCGLSWADTHAQGMSGPSTLLAYGADPSGYYNSAADAGFWYRELMDARYAGLSYLLPNVYGPDITNGSIANLASALATIASMGVTAQVKIGMVDDTSVWNNSADDDFEPWLTGPWSSTSGPENLSAAGVTAAATEIFQDKWQPYFSQIPQQYWYEVNGGPLIYFYNGGTLYVDANSQPTITTIIQLLKSDFQAAFGVTPYVVIDNGFSYGKSNVADNQFVWNTLSSPYVPQPNLSTYVSEGVTADLAMVKWDPTQRNNGANAIASPVCEGSSIIKNDSLLQSILSRTTNDTFLTIATWNDLGEGTGINRNYDYYVDGQWEPPNYFMNDIRHSQAQVTCVVATSTFTNTATCTFTNSATDSATNTSTQTATNTNTKTVTSTPTNSVTNTQTNTVTNSNTNTATNTETNSATNTATDSTTATPTSSPSLTASRTATNTPTATATNTATNTATKTVTSTASNTATDSTTATPSLTAAASTTATPSPTNTGTSTASPTPTFTMAYTVTKTNTPTSTMTESPVTEQPTSTYTSTPSSTCTVLPAVSVPPVLYPNPSNGTAPVNFSITLTAASGVRVQIFTVSLRKVKDMTFPNQPVGTSTVSMDLTDNAGYPLANGLYYVVVQTNPNRWVEKLLVLR